MEYVDALDTQNTYESMATITVPEFEEIHRYESLAFEGNSKDIISFVNGIYPDSIGENELMTVYANFVPAWVVEHPTEGEKIILNTELVKNPDIQRVFKRHESVEIIMSRKNLSSIETAKTAGLDPQIIIGDLYNTPAHYAALYHQTKFAKELGVTGDMFKEMKKSISTFLTEHLLPSTKKEAEANGEPWQQCFKYKTQELVRLNISTLRQIIKHVSNE